MAEQICDVYITGGQWAEVGGVGEPTMTTQFLSIRITDTSNELLVCSQ